MNTVTFKAITATAICAVFGAAGLILAAADAAPAPAPQIVKLERVVITGKRATEVARIEHLPRVVVEGRRADTETLAQAERRCTDPALC